MYVVIFSDKKNKKISLSLIFFIILLFCAKASCTKKQIAIAAAKKYECGTDKDYYYDNVGVLVDACKLEADVDCHVIDIEDTSVKWQTFDALILGIHWTYAQENSIFYEWLADREKEKTLIVNGPKTTRMALNKVNYLTKLQSAGVSVIPTIYISSDTTDSEDIFDIASKQIMRLTPDQVNLQSIFDQTSASHIVVKSADAMLGIDNFKIPSTKNQYNTGCNEAEEKHTSYAQYEEKIRDLGKKHDLLLQRFMPGIIEGEISFAYFNEKIYAYRKVPKLGEYKVHRLYGGTIKPYQPDINEITQARNVIQKLREVTGEKIYKARIDMVKDETTGRLHLMEAELTDCSNLLTQLYGKQMAIQKMQSYLKSIIMDIKQ